MGDDWLHEPKWDGFRFQAIKDGSEVRFHSRHGAEYTERLPTIIGAFAAISAHAAIIDGELVLIDPRGAAHFYRLMAQMRTRAPGLALVANAAPVEALKEDLPAPPKSYLKRPTRPTPTPRPLRTPTPPR